MTDEECVSWWRVQFRSDGTVESVVEGEYDSGPGRYVAYVQATSRDAAIAEAAAWLAARKAVKARYDAKVRAERIEAGICSKSGCSNAPRDGRLMCDGCAAKATEAGRRYRERADAEDDLRVSKTDPVVRFEDFKARRAALSCSTTWLSLAEKYDSMGPEGFRAWLASKIESYRAIKQAGK